MEIDHLTIRRLAADLAPAAIELRRDLHAHPELAHRETRTTGKVVEILEAEGIAVRHRLANTGLSADIGVDGPLVGLRADIDALAIHEMTAVPFRSRTDGVMHACGHDAHAAMTTYAAVLLNRLGVVDGRIRFLFQPAEETIPGGAVEMVREGLVEDVDQLMAFHVDPSIPAGTFGLRTGPITASSDRFEIVVEGPGGHTARPHDTVDTITAAAGIVTEVPRLLHGQIDARTPFVLVFGRVAGGLADNVIPTSVTLGGTARTADRRLWDQLGGMVEAACQSVAELSGAKVTVHYQRGIPPVVNDVGLIEGFRRRLAVGFGADAIHDSHTSMGAEDFARYLDHTRGALVRLGAGIPERSVDLHSASFDMDEAAIEVGIAGAAVALLGMLEDATRG